MTRKKLFERIVEHLEEKGILTYSNIDLCRFVLLESLKELKPWVRRFDDAKRIPDVLNEQAGKLNKVFIGNKE